MDQGAGSSLQSQSSVERGKTDASLNFLKEVWSAPVSEADVSGILVHGGSHRVLPLPWL